MCLWYMYTILTKRKIRYVAKDSWQFRKWGRMKGKVRCIVTCVYCNLCKCIVTYKLVCIVTCVYCNLCKCIVTYKLVLRPSGQCALKEKCRPGNNGCNPVFLRMRFVKNHRALVENTGSSSRISSPREEVRRKKEWFADVENGQHRQYYRSITDSISSQAQNGFYRKNFDRDTNSPFRLLGQLKDHVKKNSHCSIGATIKIVMTTRQRSGRIDLMEELDGDSRNYRELTESLDEKDTCLEVMKIKHAINLMRLRSSLNFTFHLYRIRPCPLFCKEY
ncbi:hypothetical protein WN51_06169 [Melipona quadrifasciata]|uniref:Uncharacterized protein n=1 Tax=Melipona quadrifasciata TaxID=166423 RepID=A0A0N0BCL1_9HYME|nr:hypothetical protein WN51_06169 [Melipona quadrifasciata]